MRHDPEPSTPTPSVAAGWTLTTIVVWNVAGLVGGSGWLVYYFAWWGLGLPEQPVVSKWLTFWGYVLSGSDWWVGVGVGYAILMVSFYPGVRRFIRTQNRFRRIALRVAIASGFSTTLIALLPFLIVLRVIR